MELWLSLQGIPAQGQEFDYADQAIWADRWRDYDIPLKPGRPVTARLFVQVQDQGCMIRGRIQGSVTMACSRCVAETELPIEAEFTHFEAFGPVDDNYPDEVYLREAGGVYELDVAALLWEQFVLALPDKPLCRPDCKGLCTGCGADLNAGPCSCPGGKLDPRMAVFRSLKVS